MMRVVYGMAVLLLVGCAVQPVRLPEPPPLQWHPLGSQTVYPDESLCDLLYHFANETCA